MTSRSEIVTAARRWLGTAARHQGRVRGAGVDCVGIWIGIARDLGRPPPEIGWYGQFPHEADVRSWLDRNMVLAWDRSSDTDPNPLPGQLGLFRWVGTAIHLAVITGAATMLHAYAPAGRVIEHPIAGGWMHRLVALYDPCDIED
jgi:cell wall-associated NlpC family hydrolase